MYDGVIGVDDGVSVGVCDDDWWLLNDDGIYEYMTIVGLSVTTILFIPMMLTCAEAEPMQWLFRLVHNL